MLRSLGTLLLGVVAVFTTEQPSMAWHHGCRVGSYLSSWGAYGMGGGFRAPLIGGYCAPRYVGWCVPRVSWGFGCNIGYGCYRPSYTCYWPAYVGCYQPTTFVSNCYSVGCWDACASPTYVDCTNSCYPTVSSCNPTWLGCGSFANTSYISSSFDSYPSYLNNVSQTQLAPSFVAKSSLAGNNLVATSPSRKSNPFVLLTSTASGKPVSNQAAIPAASKPNIVDESWMVLAMQLIDSMATNGGVHEGLAACEHLVNSRSNLPSEVYWRAAILASLAGRESKQVARWLAMAEQAGDRFTPTDLPGGSLRAYIQRIPGQTLDSALNRHAKTALVGDQPIEAYLVLSAFLKNDGQTQRAEKFMLAAKGRLEKSQSDSFKSPVLLSSTQRLGK